MRTRDRFGFGVERRLAALLCGCAALAGALTGCSGLINVVPDEEPPAMITLAPDGAPTALALSGPILVEAAEAPGELMTTRVAVRPSVTEVRYLRAMEWTERPARLFARLLANALAATAQTPVLTQAQIDLPYDFRLTGRLSAFDLAPAGGGGTARIRYVATLVRSERAEVIATRTFAAEADVVSLSPGSVASGFNDAANAVATDVADWLAGLPTLQRR